MAFNGSGTFNRLYNWTQDAANSIRIRADRMDAEDTGFATGLSNCITRDGQSPATANIPMGAFKITGLGNGTSSTDAINLSQLAAPPAVITGVDGTAALPAYSFSADVNTGTYRIGADQLGFSTNGILRRTISTTAETGTLVQLAPDGAVGAPGWSFSSETNSGLYRVSAGVVGVAVLGVQVANYSATIRTTTLVNQGPAGAVGAPAYSFSSDTNTGIYQLSADVLGVTTGGTVRQVVDASGNIIWGATAAVAYGSGGSNLFVQGFKSGNPVEFSGGSDGTADGTPMGAISSYTTGSPSADKRLGLILFKCDGSNAGSTNGKIEFQTCNAGTNAVQATLNKSGQFNATTLAEGGTALTAKYVQAQSNGAALLSFKVYVSGQVALPTSGTQQTFTHSLGATPTSFDCYAVCTTTDIGYAVNDVLKIVTQDAGVSLSADSTTIYYRNTQFNWPSKNTGAASAITVARWNIYVVARTGI